jgi:peroxin-1
VIVVVQQAVIRTASSMPSKSQPLSFQQSDFSEAIDGYTPASLMGVKLHQSDVSWTDIGGLNVARKTLLETLEWPTTYAPIFAKCPLRLRSG